MLSHFDFFQQRTASGTVNASLLFRPAETPRSSNSAGNWTSLPDISLRKQQEQPGREPQSAAIQLVRIPIDASENREVLEIAENLGLFDITLYSTCIAPRGLP